MSKWVRPETDRPIRGKRFGLLFIGLILAAAMLVVSIAVVITKGAAFGGKLSGERLARAERSTQWRIDRFQNAQPIWADGKRAWWRFLFGSDKPNVEPDLAVPVIHTDASIFASPPSSGLRITWFGHSSAMVEIDGKRVLIDPFWSERASPVSWVGPKRWYAPPISLSELPEIDAVVISHDHVDHLDYATIVAMKSWRTQFIVPLGVGVHLVRWGVPDNRIVELDWWQSRYLGNLEIVATPARHASGRITAKGNKTLWASYALIGEQHRVWYSGDTGFHDDLPKIGNYFGPFDVTLIEAGQYDAFWPDTHLGPEMAVEAHRLVRGVTMIPVHWALIKQAEHVWTEPAERVLAAANCHRVKVLIPRPGESIEPTQVSHTQAWWPAIPWQLADQNSVIATKRGVPSDRVSLAPCSE